MSSRKSNSQSSPEPIDLTLKRLDRWVKLIAIVGGILGFGLTLMSIWNLHGQNSLHEAQRLLLERQTQAESEKQRVNVGMELVASDAPDHAVNISLKLTNYSVRQVHIAMIGVRIWKQDWKDADNILETHPELLLHSISKVADCPENICPRNTSKGILQSTQHAIVLGPGGGSEIDSFGTYVIPLTEWKRGIWIQGFAYTEEQDEGKCVVVGPPVVEGGFPIFCEEFRRNEQRCDKKARCLYADVANFHYTARQ